MGHSKSKLETHKSNDVLPSKHKALSRRRIPHLILVWLDANVNIDIPDYRNTITHLRQMIQTVHTFTNGDDCIRFLEDSRDEKICIIISGSLGKLIVPRINDLSQIDSIFIFCRNKQYHETWVNGWRKIEGIYTDIKLLCNTLEQLAKDCEQDDIISFGLIPTGSNLTKDLDRLDPMFMYTQIIKEILLSINFEDKHILEFTKYCRESKEVSNTNQLYNINKFEQEYRKQKPIWWYTWESFLYRMLNAALRLADIDTIIKMGFFIHDLHRQIEYLHQQQFRGANKNKIFTVYRGQIMFKEEFEQILKNKGGLISFTQFLSTSKNEKISMRFAKSCLKNSDTVGVLFVMTIDPQQSTTPFASVDETSFYKAAEKEILFAMHTIFRILDVKQNDGDERLFRVELILTNDNDEELQMLTKFIRKETFPNSPGWDRLGLVLLQLGKAKQAEDVYEILLQQETDESKNGWLFQRLGRCKAAQKQYTEAIQFDEKSIEIYEKYSPQDPSLPKSYGNIGNVYFNMGKYDKALSFHEKALAIKQQSSESDLLDLAVTYNNIGNIHRNMGDHDKAISSFETALSIRQKLLPPTHHSLAATYINLGLVYERMYDYSTAYSCYEKAVKIEEKSLPSNHPNLQDSRNKLGRMKDKLQSYHSSDIS